MVSRTPAVYIDLFKGKLKRLNMSFLTESASFFIAVDVPSVVWLLAPFVLMHVDVIFVIIYK